MDTLTAVCYDCDTEIEVFGYWLGHGEDGRDEYELDVGGTPTPHLNHDVSITGAEW